VIKLTGIFFALFLIACSGPRAANEQQLSVGGTTLGNPFTQLSTTPFTTTSANFAFSVCLDEILFERADGTVISEKVNGLSIALNPAGTILPNINPPPGDYVKIELRIGDTCDTPTTLSNSVGDFSSTIAFGMLFSGTRTETGDRTPWSLNFQPIVDELELVTRDAKISIHAEAALGTF
jgi:hypothetical protein